MNKSDILSALRVLKQDASECEAQLNLLRSIINRYESRLTSIDSENSAATTTNAQLDKAYTTSQAEVDGSTERAKHPDFPKDESLQFQIIFLLNKIGRAVRLPDLLEELNKAIAGGESDKTISNNQIRSYTNKLKEEGKLFKVKFNNSNTLVFVGLPEWFEKNHEDKISFKEEFKPPKKELPFGTKTIELT